MSFLYIPMSRGSNGSNTFVGVGALQNVTTGVDNSAFGFYALNALVSGNRNTAVGSEALLLNTSSNNTAVGSGALRGSTTGQNNVALGQDAMRAGNPNNSNVAVGYSAMYNCGLTENSVGIGQFALYNAAGTIGNTAVGNTAGLLITTGSKNTILGAFTGNQFGLDIRTLSNYIVISDGDGNPRIWVDNAGLVNFPGGSVLPGGTANGVLYLNGSKVVSSGSVLTWDAAIGRLDVDTNGNTGHLRLNAFGNEVGKIRTPFGGAAYNIMQYDVISGGSHLWSINGNEQMRLSSTGLGIGTTSPSGRLDVRGSSYIGTDANNSFFVDSTATLVRIGAAGRTAFSTSALAFITSDGTGALERMRLDASGNVIVNTAAVATNATNGFLYVAGCAGTPTGTPTAYTGRVPIVVDTTNNKLYFYSGGAWRDAGP